MIIWIVALVCIGAGAIYQFIKLGKEKQIDKIREWLIYATIEAEKVLGAKTGQVKLRFVYDMFISKFRIISVIIPFEVFSDLVDEALEKVRGMLESNDKIQEYVGGDK